MSESIEPGFYKHVEGGLYRVSPNQESHFVRGEGTDEIVGEPVVTYQAQYTSQNYGPAAKWTRPVANFLEEVTVGDQSLPRFQRMVEPSLPAENDPLGLTAETIYEDDERSIAFVALNGINRRVVNRRSTTTYEVLEGEGSIKVGGAIQPLEPGSMVTVPAGKPYQGEGRLVMAATSIPPYDPNDVAEAPDPQQLQGHPYSLVFFRDDGAGVRRWTDRVYTVNERLLAEQTDGRTRNMLLAEISRRVHKFSDYDNQDKSIQIHPQGITVLDPSILRDDNNPLLGVNKGIRKFGSKAAIQFATFAEAATVGTFLPPQFHKKSE